MKTRISRQTVSLIERNEYMPSLLISVRIANVFQEPVENVFFLVRRNCLEDLGCVYCYVFIWAI